MAVIRRPLPFVTAVALFVLVCGSLWIFFLRGQAAPLQVVMPPPSAAVLIMLGEQARSAERWDGSLSITGGELGTIEGRQFLAGDTITGADSWKCAVRTDAVEPYADIHYTELRPGSKPPILYHPVGIYASVRSHGDPRFSVRTTQGSFAFTLSELGGEPKRFLNGRASAARVPAPQKLTDAAYEHDEPALVALPDGGMAVAWVAYRDRADRVLFRLFQHSVWSPPEEISARAGDIFRCALAADRAGNIWAFWSERQGDHWEIQARKRVQGTWQRAERLAARGSNTFLRAASSPDGSIFLAWQSERERQSDIYLKVLRGATWSDEIKVSESAANDWEPAIAAGSDGAAHIVWDTYEKGDYDIVLRSWKDGSLSELRRVTSGPQFQAHASVAIDAQSRPWLAWDESGVNWGKDQGFLIPTPLATPLHKQRSIRLAVWDGGRLLEPANQPAAAFPDAMRQNAEHPFLAFDGGSTPVMVFRHWTRQKERSIGSPMNWENFVTRLQGSKWTTPIPLLHSAGSAEKNPALALANDGSVYAVWMTDNRPFATQVPQHADIYYANLGAAVPSTQGSEQLRPLAEASPEAILVHPHETEDINTARTYVVAAGKARYRIYRGDMHRHSDVSQDFKYDGSLLEIYRYAKDAAMFDYIAITDHQAGFDQEFTWWQNQKLAHLFYSPASFVPLFAYERSVPYPNGHRNVIFAHPGVRTLPIPPEEAAGKVGAAKLFQYLRQNGGISMPHSTATSQGTDWRDNDPEVEPLMEIYQGYRTSYEYEGAPRSATTGNPQAQKSGWEPKGFLWNALAKGYKLGVQASSDHWYTHISYACLLAENFSREGLLDAIRKRHAYGATDNIVLDVQAKIGDTTYVMGDVIHSQ